MERRNLPVISAAAAAAFSTPGEWTAPTQTTRALQVEAWRRRGGMEEGKRVRETEAREKKEPEEKRTERGKRVGRDQRKGKEGGEGGI